MKRVLLGLVVVLLLVLLVFPSGVTGDPNLEERVNQLEVQVAYLETFHPTTTTTTVPPSSQALVFDVDTVLTEPLVLRPGDTVELQNGAQLRFGPGSFLDAQGTLTSTWSDLGDTQNLIRDINIFGAGDIMFMAGSLPSTIRYVNVDLQPLFIFDHYPLHWHEAGDSVRGTVIEGVVVQNSTNRCVVPHASNGITFTDLICKNIDKTAIWWNDFPIGEVDSDDIVFNHILVDGVNVPPSGSGKYRTFGAELMGGNGNVMVNSVVMNVGGKGSSGGFFWSLDDRPIARPTQWTFRDNTVRDVSKRCVFFWVNDTKEHLIENLTCLGAGSVIEHGAYLSKPVFINPTVDEFVLKAVAGRIEGGTIGRVYVTKQVKTGLYTITDTQVGQLVIDNGGSDEGVQLSATNIGLSCADVEIVSLSAVTTITIDGVQCDLGG